jgi:hypothetical protein
MGGQLPCFLASCLSLVATDQTPTVSAPTFHFYCNTGYSQADCDGQVRRLREVLAGMDLAPLGDWTWVLVRSQDWKPILRGVGRNTRSPAFAILQKRQIFLEEALFRADPERSRELLAEFRMPLDQLLSVAVAHELAHALCQDTDEARAKAYAAELSSTGKATCLAPSRR